MLALEKFWQKLKGLGDNTEKACGTESTLSLETVAFLQQLVGELGCNARLYQTALTHRSVVHDPATIGMVESNQRLEFLGDSVLGMLISEYLFKSFPESAEGELSSNRAKIVNSKSLAGFARSLNLGDYLILGESADYHKIRSSESALADAFESLIGAIYLDKGIKAAYDFVIHHIIEHVNFKTIVAAEHNYKSRLIEHTPVEPSAPSTVHRDNRNRRRARKELYRISKLQRPDPRNRHRPTEKRCRTACRQRGYGAHSSHPELKIFSLGRTTFA